MKKLLTLSLTSILALALISFSVAGIYASADSGHQLVNNNAPQNNFATTDQGCLGPLRSLIAQGLFNGVGPFGEHFTGTVDPGAHYGTAGEAAFLEQVIGVSGAELSAFCAAFSPQP